MIRQHRTVSQACVIVGAACIGALAGCSSAPAPEPSATGTFANLVDSYLADSAASGYSDAQVQTLERAKQEGRLTFEDYSAAIDLSLACISDAGYYVERSVSDASHGYPEVSYFYEGPEDGNPVADRCIHENSEGIEAIYQLQPESVDASNRHTAAQVDELRPCLDALGVDLDVDGLTADETADALFRLIQHEQAQILDSGGTLPGPIERCFIGVGL